MPPMPHPAPKSTPAARSWVSITLLVGRSNLGASTGLRSTPGSTRASMKGAKTPRPPAMTNMSVGFHVPALTSRNWATRAAEVMPERPRPQAKSVPSRKLSVWPARLMGTALEAVSSATAAYAARCATSRRAARDTMSSTGGSGSCLAVTAVAECRREAAVKPAAMKVSVYAIDLGDRRALPLMPCPEVQPLPRPAPKPTSRPPATWRQGAICVTLNAAGCSACMATPPATRPPTNAHRDTSMNLPRQRPPAMPLTPRMRPVSHMRMRVAVPRSAPPMPACTGVNS
mmetsp:Transcript_22079/g.59563  ORF Transcript_22079/g.59563 Transcript_22079/m.59563 type:complete len:286 (-) Transcript_22079:36-893(-)